MNCKGLIILLCSFVIMFTAFSAYSADSAQEQLNQYLSELQKNQYDPALREKVIRHVQAMKTAPAVSEDAKRSMARGKVAFESARTDADYGQAIVELKNANAAAPWVAATYYNLALAYQASGLEHLAITELKLYLLAAPAASDAEAVKSRIYGLEYKLEQKQKAKSLTDQCDEFNKAGRLAEAVTACKEATRIDPKYGMAHYNLGVVLRQRYGSSPDANKTGCREAIPEFEEAIRLGYGIDAHNNLSYCYIWLEDFRKGKSIMEEGMRKLTAEMGAFAPRNDMAFAYLRLGDACWGLNEYRNALDYYQKARELGATVTEQRMNDVRRALGR